MSVSRQRGILTPMTKVQQVDTGAGSFEQGLADIAFSTAEVLADKANKQYEMDFRNTAQQEINDAYSRNQNNPEQLRKELQAAESGLIRNAPRNLRDTFRESFRTVSQPFVNKATSNHDKILTGNLRESSLKNLDNARIALNRTGADLFSSDPLVVNDASKATQAKVLEVSSTLSQTDINGNPIFSGDDRFKLMKKFIDDTMYSSIIEAYEGSEDKGTFLSMLENDELRASMFIDEQGNFVEDSVKARMDRKTYEKVRNFMEKDIAKLTVQSEKAAIDQERLQMMELVKQNQFVLDPWDKEQKKAVDLDWGVVSRNNQGLSEMEQAQVAVDYVSNVGVLPTALESQTRGLLQNGEPSQRAIAADVVERISKRRPSALAQFSERERIMAKQINEGIEAGLTPEKAVEFADINVFDGKSTEYQVRLQKFKDEGEPFSEGDFTEFFRNDPDEVPAGMIADYNVLNRKYFMDGGLEKKAAHDLAVEKVKQRWSPTRIGNLNRWMKYAPEVMYNNEVDNMEWLGPQLDFEIQEALGTKPEKMIIEIAPEDIGKPDPRYMVFEQKESGEIEPVRLEDGKQVLWKPDYKTSPHYLNLLKEYDEDKEAAMNAAKRIRRNSAFEANMMSIREGF